MQDFYNILAVVIFLPLELAFGAISKAARGLAGLVTAWGSDSGPSEGGGGLSLGDIVDAPVDALANLLNGWGLGTAAGPVMIALGLAALAVAQIGRASSRGTAY